MPSGPARRITGVMSDLSAELIPTRATLIQRLKNWQDQASWQDFFDIYSPLIYGVARKRGLTISEAEDVVQETLIAVAKHMPSFKYDPAMGSFKAWLLNMTRWRIADHIRAHRPPAAWQQSPEEASLGYAIMAGAADHTIPDLEKLWDEEWNKTLLDAATAKARRGVDPKQYQIFDFYVNKEWPPERVAKAFGISPGQVYQAKHRMIGLIKEEFARLHKEII